MITSFIIIFNLLFHFDVFISLLVILFILWNTESEQLFIVAKTGSYLQSELKLVFSFNLFPALSVAQALEFQNLRDSFKLINLNWF